MTREAPSWLEEFQARFGAVVRTPLDRATGTLRATPGAYDPIAVDGTLDGPVLPRGERLAVYNRQYWFRLFRVLHDAFPLVCRLVGYWTFNAIAARYLEAHAPRGWDLDTVPDAFAAFLVTALDGSVEGFAPAAAEREAIGEAAAIDAAYRDVFRAPPVAPFRPSAEDAARLLGARLERSPAVAILEEQSALADLRRTILREPSERRAAFPRAWPEIRRFALVRGAEGTGEIPLEAREAELLRLLEAHPVRDAVALLERACPSEEREGLPARMQGWLAASVQRGWWSGMRV
ncbi:MAG: DNA-binding domain-containing protein [Polyangiaceae bacterium]